MLDKVKVLVPFILAALGGFVYRLRGGLPVLKSIPRQVKRLLCIVPLVGISLLVAPLWVSLALGLGTFFAISLGHGTYMDLGTFEGKEDRVQSLDWIVSLFFGPNPNTLRAGPGNYWRDAFGLALTGFVVTLPLGLVLGYYVGPLLGFFTSLIGFIKWPMYHIGQKFSIPFLPGAERGIEVGEWLFGFALWFLTGLVLIYLL